MPPRYYFHLGDNVVDDDRPIVDLAGDDVRGGEGGLVARIQPQQAVFFRDTYRANDHLGGTGHHVCTSVHVRVGGLRGQGDIAERADVVDVDLDVGFGGDRAGFEPVYVQFGIAHFDGANDADDAGGGQGQRPSRR